MAAPCRQLGLSAREERRGDPKTARLDSKCRSEPEGSAPVDYRRFFGVFEAPAGVAEQWEYG